MLCWSRNIFPSTNLHRSARSRLQRCDRDERVFGTTIAFFSGGDVSKPTRRRLNTANGQGLSDEQLALMYSSRLGLPATRPIITIRCWRLLPCEAIPQRQCDRKRTPSRNRFVAPAVMEKLGLWRLLRLLHRVCVVMEELGQRPSPHHVIGKLDVGSLRVLGGLERLMGATQQPATFCSDIAIRSLRCLPPAMPRQRSKRLSSDTPPNRKGHKRFSLFVGDQWNSKRELSIPVRRFSNCSLCLKIVAAVTGQPATPGLATSCLFSVTSDQQAALAMTIRIGGTATNSSGLQKAVHTSPNH